MNKFITDKDIKGHITPSVRKLKKTKKNPPYVFLDSNDKVFLCVTRRGNTTLLPITRRVAEELIASGMSYGN